MSYWTISWNNVHILTTKHSIFAGGGTLNRLTSTRSLPGMVNQEGVSDEEIIPQKQSNRLSSSTPDILDIPDEPGNTGESATKSGEGTDATDDLSDENRLRPPSRTKQEQSGSQEEM